MPGAVVWSGCFVLAEAGLHHGAEPGPPHDPERLGPHDHTGANAGTVGNVEELRHDMASHGLLACRDQGLWAVFFDELAQEAAHKTGDRLGVDEFDAIGALCVCALDREPGVMR